MLPGAAPFAGETKSQGAFSAAAAQDKLDCVALPTETTCGAGASVPAVHRNSSCALDAAMAVTLDDGMNSIDFIATFTLGEVDIVNRRRLMLPRHPARPASGSV